MAVYNPQYPDALQRRLQCQDTTLLVVCFCAAWCDTCTTYQADFEALANAWPAAMFIWIDIEEHSELLGEEDIENFPTVMLQTRQNTVFFGEQPPQIGHLERLIRTFNQDPAALRPVDGPPLLADILSA
ncbi:MAG TPA: thioredoxin family protein [Burkholderiaceae bacterium]|nr:thioredoxin family protein [Burkholderiaceae bacterium]